VLKTRQQRRLSLKPSSAGMEMIQSFYALALPHEELTYRGSIVKSAKENAVSTNTHAKSDTAVKQKQ